MTELEQADLVLVEIAGGVATLTLNSPANRNALSAPLRAQLLTGLDQALAAAVRVIVLDHAGPVFCAGMDLLEVAAGRAGIDELPPILRRIMHAPVPVVAAVRGSARAGGVGLLAACDLVISDVAATFALTEVRLGLSPAVITVPLLRRMNPAGAREVLLTGRVFSAAEAWRFGLVDRLTDDVGTKLAAAVEEFRGAGPSALALTKGLLARDYDDSDARYSRLLIWSAAQFASAEAREGALAFVEKRPPRW